MRCAWRCAVRLAAIVRCVGTGAGQRWPLGGMAKAASEKTPIRRAEITSWGRRKPPELRVMNLFSVIEKLKKEKKRKKVRYRERGEGREREKREKIIGKKYGERFLAAKRPRAPQQRHVSLDGTHT